MKCLSLRQPYAELILQGKKTIESRVWNTEFRGEFLIHTSLGISPQACKRFGFDPKGLVRGFIVGKASVVNVIEYPNDMEYLKDSGKHLGSKEGLEEFGWAGRKKYGFVLESVERLEPIKFKGQLSFFETGLRIDGGGLVKDNSQKPISGLF